MLSKRLRGTDPHFSRTQRKGRNVRRLYGTASVWVYARPYRKRPDDHSQKFERNTHNALC